VLVDDLEEKLRNERSKRGKELSFLYSNKTAYKASFVACGYAPRFPHFPILFLETQDFAAGIESFHTRRTRFTKVKA
jgi:hypothetical protein